MSGIKSKLDSWTDFLEKHKVNKPLKNRISILSDLSRKYPEDPRPLFSLGLEYIEKGEDETALNFFKRATSLDPTWAQPFYYSAVLLHNKGRLRESKLLFEKVKFIAATGGDIMYQELIDTCVKLGDYKVALYYGDRYFANKHDANKASDDLIFFNRAYAKRHLNDLLGAKEDYLSSIKINPNSDSAYLNLAEVCFNLDLYEEAKLNYTKCLEKNPGNKNAYLGRAWTSFISSDILGFLRDMLKFIF